MFHDIAHLQQLSSCVGTNSCGIGASGPLMFGGIQFDDTQVSASWLADSDNGATALAMTGSDQGAYNSYSAVHTYWADTTAMDNIRGADITDGTIAGSTETISGNVSHTDSNLDAP